jgi:iron complex outermembrane recepter protein
MKKVFFGALLCAGNVVAYAQQDKKITDTLFLQPVEISSVKAGVLAPFAKTNLTQKDIDKVNIGQDIPFLLEQTPSVVVNSDAGNGVGYTGIHIRGSDATRINVTLNGIPYNDAEDGGTYWVDIPDMASSLSSIQIQRGVGTSSNGTGAFGATIALTTNEFNKDAYADVNNSYGSFNTWKNTIKVGSGLIDDHFTIDARLSQETSDGYIQRASSDLKSFALSGAYITKRSSLRLNIFSGKEKTYQAWDGVPADSVATNPTYNDLGTEKPGAPYNNQTDNYQQDHYQLFFNHTINSLWTFNTAVFMTYGRGYYQEYHGVAAEAAAGDSSQTSYSYYGLPNPVYGTDTIANSDLVRQLWLDNHFYGQIASLDYKNKKDEVTIGGSWTRYVGTHYGDVTWAQYGGIPNDDYQYYNHPDLKTDENIYTKWQHALSNNWSTFIDLQYRNVYHRMDGFEGDSVKSVLDSLNIARTFNFVNPKAGITYTKNGWQAYFSYAMANKEPNYTDFEAATTDQPKTETLNDFELGAERKHNNYTWGANIYYMYYLNQLILTGNINSVGAYIRTNTPYSYRLGLELQGSYIFAKWLNAEANCTFSQNKINTFSEILSGTDSNNNPIQKEIDHTNTDISFSPDIIIGGSINFIPVKNGDISFISKYVDRQYMDNTSTIARSILPYFAENVRLSYSLKNKIAKETDIILQINNLFSTKYNSYGYTYTDIEGGSDVTYNNYFPMAPINYMVGLDIHF